MKKIVFSLLFFGFIIGIGTPVFAAENEGVSDAVKLIQQTNKEIDQIIDEGVNAADSLQAQYLLDVQAVEDEKVELENELVEAETNLSNANSGLPDTELHNLTTLIENLKSELQSKDVQLQQLEKNYREELQSIIDYVFNVTLEMSQTTIQKVAEYGVIAECSWKLVRFADQYAWIDPIKIIGIN